LEERIEAQYAAHDFQDWELILVLAGFRLFACLAQ
jgi:hypothetical protein